jgi:hypothetical protein
MRLDATTDTRTIKTVKDQDGHAIGISGSGFAATPVFDASGRLVGFRHRIA